MLRSVYPVLHVQWDNNLTVTMGFEVVGRVELFAQDSVVVDFAIDSQSNGSLIVNQRLCASVHTHDTESLMAEDCVVSDPVA